MGEKMNRKKMDRMISGIQDNQSGLEFTIFDGFFMSEKSIKMQQGGILSFFVKKDFVNKDVVRMAIDKISGEDNCIYIHSVIVKPKSKASRYRRNAFIYKIKGVTCNDSKRKIYARLKNPGLFLSKIMDVQDMKIQNAEAENE
jgi:hypothetical protein